MWKIYEKNLCLFNGLFCDFSKMVICDSLIQSLQKVQIKRFITKQESMQIVGFINNYCEFSQN